jgi:HPt (histidine-containing phosphotransfer) domain-containing protein
VFDPLALPGLIGDDAALIEEFLAEYRTSASNTVHSIRQACAAGNWRQTGELAHRLKSSSRSVGAMQMGQICAAIEDAGRKGDGALIGRLAAELDSALDTAMSAMRYSQATPGA